jgi:hypothetical protein
MWFCRVDAMPWPCAAAKLSLTAGFDGHMISLTLFLASQFVDALGDLHTISPDPAAAPDSRALYERFIGWVPVRRT